MACEQPHRVGALEATANHAHDRLVMIANWENVAPDPAAIEGLRLALVAPPPSFCSPSPSIARARVPAAAPSSSRAPGCVARTRDGAPVAAGDGSA